MCTAFSGDASRCGHNAIRRADAVHRAELPDAHPGDPSGVWLLVVRCLLVRVALTVCLCALHRDCASVAGVFHAVLAAEPQVAPCASSPVGSDSEVIGELPCAKGCANAPICGVAALSYVALAAVWGCRCVILSNQPASQVRCPRTARPLCESTTQRTMPNAVKATWGLWFGNGHTGTGCSSGARATTYASKVSRVTSRLVVLVASGGCGGGGGNRACCNRRVQGG